MNLIKKTIVGLLLVLSGIFAVLPVYAQAPKGILPGLDDAGKNKCDTWKKATTENPLRQKGVFMEKIKKAEDRNMVLACAIKTGKIRLYMMPYFVIYLIEFLLQIAGLIAVLFVVYGGYKYAVGGITEDKESGKKIILHALVGLVVAFSAWIIVNLVQIALTS